MAALPAVRACSPELPEHPDFTRILAVFNEETGTLRARDVAQALGHELPPTNVVGIRAKPKRLVELDVLTDADTGSFARKPERSRACAGWMPGVGRAAAGRGPRAGHATAGDLSDAGKRAPSAVTG
ncbi:MULTISPECIES: hypothetical protein [Streptomyces]|uniref:hypothetical protein n=1 Tax=Streptomyces TaxID=1883 RepID=UPI00164DC99E|nr:MULTISPECIES: hypothetical protein [Streptomyces]MCZ4098537.1 hypothetical protein [Streptomyces sp. H39-C1]